MKCYRIMTEDKNTDQLIGLVSARFECFTVYHGTGYWRGIAEASLTIEIIDTEDSIHIDMVKLLAQSIKRLNDQEAVLVTVSDIEGELL